MRDTNERVEEIEGYIYENIEILSGKGISKLDKDISYMLIQENIDTIIKLYNESVDLRQKEDINKKIIVVREKLFSYLTKVNNWDEEIFEQYRKLTRFI